MKKGHQHFKIYKPVGMLSQMQSGEAKQLRNKLFLKNLYDFPEGIMPVGRLDEKSEGLLLMTTDGKRANEINTAGVEKEYMVQLDGIISQTAIEKLTKGVSIGVFGKRYTTKPCRVAMTERPTFLQAPDACLRVGRHRPTSWITISLTEGKFRQIRKMTAAVGYPTVRLVRVRVGNIYLDAMKPKEVVRLSTVDMYSMLPRTSKS